MTKQKHFYLIRGLMREKGHWGSFLEHLQIAFPDCLITSLDIPGAGDYHDSPSPLSITRIVEQMRLDYLKTKLPTEESHLVAISLGGMIAIEWIRKFPTDFSTATLINTSMGRISPFHQRLKPSALWFLLKIPLLKGRQMESRILKLVSHDESLFEKTLDAWEIINKKRPVSILNTIRQLYAAASYRPGNFRPIIPIQILASTNDKMVNTECSRAIARKWNLPFEEHPSAGHELTVDDPQWVVNKIKNHLL